jgi:hypothetical protein
MVRGDLVLLLQTGWLHIPRSMVCDIMMLREEIVGHTRARY